ncbi:MAG: DUF378 domain-containing protein [Patescibacteria group bacterium]
MHNTIAHWLMVIGGVNWGLVGIGMLLGMNLNVVNLVLGGIPYVELVVYILVGIAAVIWVAGGCKCKNCTVSAPMGGAM